MNRTGIHPLPAGFSLRADLQDVVFRPHFQLMLDQGEPASNFGEFVIGAAVIVKIHGFNNLLQARARGRHQAKSKFDYLARLIISPIQE